MSELDIGLYIDDPPRLVLKRWYLERLKQLRLDHVSVMVDGTRPGLIDQRWFPADLEKLAEELCSVRRCLTFWLEPVRWSIDALDKALPDLQSAFGSKTNGADVEKRFKRRYLRGYESMEEAGEHSADVLRCGDSQVESTSFPSHPEAKSGAVVACDVFVNQIYGLHHRGEVPVQWGSRYAPGTYHRWAIAKFRRERPDVALAVAHPAWKQKFKNRDGEDAMATAMGASIAEGVTIHRTWSSKHVIRGNDYAWRFFTRDLPQVRGPLGNDLL